MGVTKVIVPNEVCDTCVEDKISRVLDCKKCAIGKIQEILKKQDEYISYDRDLKIIYSNKKRQDG